MKSKIVGQECYSHSFVKILLYFYRFMSITFGGSTIRNRELYVSSILKYFGYLSIVLAVATCVLDFLTMNTIPEFMRTSEESLVTFLSYRFWLWFGSFHVLVTTWVLQRRGPKLIRFLMKYPLTKCHFYSLLLLGMVFPCIEAFKFFFLVDVLLNGEEQHQLAEHVSMNRNIRIYHLISNMFWFPTYYLLMTVGCGLSFVGLSFLRALRLELSAPLDGETSVAGCRIKYADKIHDCRIKYVELQKDVSDVNNALAPIALVTMITFIGSIMMTCAIGTESFLKAADFSYTFFIHSVFLSMKLILFCVFCGWLHDESREVISELDSVSCDDNEAYKEAIYFLMIAKKSTIGLFVAGFPIHKSMLVSVNKQFIN